VASQRDIRRRIGAVRNIKQITRAMQFVAASKLKRAQDATLAARPYADKIDEVLADVASVLGADDRGVRRRRGRGDDPGEQGDHGRRRAHHRARPRGDLGAARAPARAARAARRRSRPGDARSAAPGWPSLTTGVTDVTRPDAAAVPDTRP